MVTLDEYLEIPQLAKQWSSKTETARRLGRDRYTVATYSGAVPGPPVSQIRPVGRRVLERFADYLRKRIDHGCNNGEVLIREIQGQGHEGSYCTHKQFLKPLRDTRRWRAEIRWEAPQGFLPRLIEDSPPLKCPGTHSLFEPSFQGCIPGPKGIQTGGDDARPAIQ